MQSSYNATSERTKLIQDWATFTIERLQRSIDKRKIGVSGSLRYSLLYALKAASEGDISAIEIFFNYYGKFVDMGVGAGVKLESVKSNSDIYDKASTARRPKKWLSKTLYAEINQLQMLLAEQYSEQIPNIIRESIQQTIIL